MEASVSAFASRDEVQSAEDRKAGTVRPPQEQVQRQMERILRSAEFRNAHTLQHLLQFLVEQAQGPDAETLKESTIGVGVFSRPPDFDPKADPVVRVQIHRLRQRLQEYYETGGRHDPILIDIPKGRYLPNFEELAEREATLGGVAVPPIETMASGNAPLVGSASEGGDAKLVATKSRQFSKLIFNWITLAVATAVAIFTVGFWLGTKRLGLEPGRRVASANTDSNFNRLNNPVKAFWAPLLGNDTTPIIAYSSVIFLVDTHDNLFRFPHGETGYRGGLVDSKSAQQFAASPALVAKAGKLYYEDSSMGSGNGVAIALLANAFGQMGLKPILEDARELTPEDLKRHNVIFVGTSLQSRTIAAFDTMGDFKFKHSPTSQKEKDWGGVIEDLNPHPGEAKFYRTERDPVTGVLTMDHALITIEPGIVSGRYIVDIGGLDSTGSEGVASFATSDTGVEELSKALAAQGIHGVKGGPALFQALLRVRLEMGDEVLGTSLIAVHPLILNETGQAAAETTKPAAH